MMFDWHRVWPISTIKSNMSTFMGIGMEQAGTVARTSWGHGVVEARHFWDEQVDFLPRVRCQNEIECDVPSGKLK